MRGRDAINRPLLDILDLLIEGGDYGVAWEGTNLQVNAWAPKSDPEGRAICMSPYILAKHKPAPEVVADIAGLLDVLLSFWRPGTEKARAYLLDRDLKPADGQKWEDLELGLLQTLLYPSTWNEEITPDARRGYIYKSVRRFVRRNADNRIKKSDPSTSADQLEHRPGWSEEPAAKGGPDILGRLVELEGKNLILSQAGLTERDLLVLDLMLFRGYTATESSAAVGGPGLSPYISVKAKLTRRKLPQKFS